jgi:hypothetical protein
MHHQQKIQASSKSLLRRSPTSDVPRLEFTMTEGHRLICSTSHIKAECLIFYYDAQIHFQLVATHSANMFKPDKFPASKVQYRLGAEPRNAVFTPCLGVISIQNRFEKTRCRATNRLSQ